MKDYFKEGDKFDEISSELREYAVQEGTEYGEYCCALIDLYNSSLFPIKRGNSLWKAVTKEMKKCLKDFKENYVWETKEIEEKRTFKVLEYRGS